MTPLHSLFSSWPFSGCFIGRASVAGLLLALAGCAVPTAGVDDDTLGNKADAFLDSSVFATCWMEVEESGALQTHAWKCEVPSHVAGLEIAFVDLSFNQGFGQMNGGDSGTVGSFGGTDPQRQYPVDFTVTVPQLRGVIGAPQRHSVTERIRNERSFTKDSPLVLELPFDVWHLEITNQWPADFLASLTVEERAASLDGFRDDGSNRGTLPGAQMFPSGDGAMTRAIVIAEKGAESVDATLKFLGTQDLGETRVQFEGTGQYLLSGEALLKTADGLSDPTTPDPTEPDPTQPDPAQPDPTTPDPTEPTPTDPACVADFVSWTADVHAAIPSSSLSASRADEMEALFDGVPCAPHGSADAFASWLELTDTLALKFYPLSRASLTADEARVMARLAPVAPRGVFSDAQYIKFVEVLTERLLQYYPVSRGQLQPEEQTLIGVFLDGAPDASTDAGYAAWFELFATRLAQVIPISRGVFDDDERSILRSIISTKPTTFDGAAFDSWQELFSRRFDSAVPRSGGRLDEVDVELLGFLLSASPGRASASGYRTWLAFFESRLVATGSRLDGDDEPTLDHAVGAKPCVVDALAIAQEAHSGLSVREHLASWVEMAAPAACE